MNVEDLFDEVAPAGVTAERRHWAQNGANGQYNIVVRTPAGELLTVTSAEWDHDGEQMILRAEE